MFWFFLILSFVVVILGDVGIQRCGGDKDNPHRKEWISERPGERAGIFESDILAFAVLR
jgi:hypothetical protein